jgi:uncharacterized protein YecE (DUF72 family)
LQYYIGCSGWSYLAWQGPFYPINLDSSKWLSHYSHVFDYVEIDSTFYRMPNPFMVKNWYKRTPDNFRFTAKFPKIITHDKRLKDVEKELEYFLDSISGLEEKILALLIQLPPSLGLAEGIGGLREIVPELDKRFRYAVEVRDSSWFQDLEYNFFRNNNNCMVWSQLAGIRIPPIVTTDFLYIRFIGDRSIDEKDFGRIQKDRVAEMKKWARKLNRIAETEKDKINLAIVAANNHYAGFGPGTANMFRKMVGLEEVTWKDKKISLTEEGKLSSTDTKQTTLADFLKQDIR